MQIFLICVRIYQLRFHHDLEDVLKYEVSKCTTNLDDFLNSHSCVFLSPLCFLLFSPNLSVLLGVIGCEAKNFRISKRTSDQKTMLVSHVRMEQVGG